MPHCLSAQEHDPAFGEQPEGWHATSLHIHEPIKEPIEAPIKEPAGPHQPLDASATQPTATVEPMTAQTPVEAVSSSASPDETGTTSAPKAKPDAGKNYAPKRPPRRSLKQLGLELGDNYKACSDKHCVIL